MLQTADVLLSDAPSAHLLLPPLIGPPPLPPPTAPLPPSRAPVCVLSASACAPAVRPNERSSSEWRPTERKPGPTSEVEPPESQIALIIRGLEGGEKIKEQRNGISSMTGTGIMRLHTRDRESELGACVGLVALSFSLRLWLRQIVQSGLED